MEFFKNSIFIFYLKPTYMKLLSDFRMGLQTYSEAFDYIFRKKLSWFFIFPLLLNILIFWVGWNYIGSLSADIQQQVLTYIHLENADFFGSRSFAILINRFGLVGFQVTVFFTVCLLGWLYYNYTVIAHIFVPFRKNRTATNRKKISF